VNHKRAPVALREQVAFDGEKVEQGVKVMTTLDGVGEALILSTCNRVELYAAGDPDTTPYQLSAFLHSFHGVADGELDDHLFRLVGEDALSHLCRVAASLDAIVVGEPQILGQVKDAFFKAAGAGTTGPVLNRAFQGAFSVAKRVRTETEIASSAVSVSYAGVELARKFFEISGCEVLLVGAGDMGELAARHFADRGASLIVCNRSLDRAQRLAKDFGGVARQWEDLPKLLEEVDVVLCSTSAPTFVITKKMMKKAVKKRRYRPIFLMDIAVPRDIDPAVSDVDLVYAYDVDDLQQVVEENMEVRRGEADRAEMIVSQEVLRLAKKDRERKAVPTIKALREQLLEVARVEAGKTLVVLGDAASEKQKKSVEKMANAIVNKILHGPVTKLKQQSVQGGVHDVDLFRAVLELFELQLIDDEAGNTEAVLKEAQAAEDALDPDVADALKAG
jgi:glutamyl-tRNA reductase